MSEETLRLTHEIVGDEAVVRLEGMLDAGSVVPLAEEFQHVRRYTVRRIRVDLSGLTALDLAGFAFLKASMHYFVCLGIELKPCGLAVRMEASEAMKRSDQALLTGWREALRE